MALHGAVSLDGGGKETEAPDMLNSGVVNQDNRDLLMAEDDGDGATTSHTVVDIDCEKEQLLPEVPNNMGFDAAALEFMQMQFTYFAKKDADKCAQLESHKDCITLREHDSTMGEQKIQIELLKKKIKAQEESITELNRENELAYLTKTTSVTVVKEELQEKKEKIHCLQFDLAGCDAEIKYLREQLKIAKNDQHRGNGIGRGHDARPAAHPQRRPGTNTARTDERNRYWAITVE